MSMEDRPVGPLSGRGWKLFKKVFGGCLIVSILAALISLGVVSKTVEWITSIAGSSTPTVVQPVSAMPTATQVAIAAQQSTAQPATATRQVVPTAVITQATPVPAKPTSPPIPTVIISTQIPTVAPTTQPSQGQKPVITVGFDAFGSYLTLLQFADNHDTSYELKLVPFLWDGEEGKYDFKEDVRADKLAKGEWDILLTTSDSLARKGSNIGKIVTEVDQSAGADKIIAWPTSVTVSNKPINKFNDLIGLTVTYSEGSVGQYQVLSTLRVVGIKPDQVHFLPAKSVAEAISNFLDHQADAVAGWEPDIQDAIDAGGRELVSSEWWRIIKDSIVVSNQANTSKKPAVKAFLRDWYKALKLQQEDLVTAARIIAGWRFQDIPSNNWTTVSEEKDLRKLLSPIAQASLQANILVMQNPQLIVQQLQSARDIWAWGGAISDTIPFDPAGMVEPSYVLELAQERNLFPTSGSLVNSSYQPVAPQAPATDVNALINAPSIAELPCTRFEYEPESTVLNRRGVTALQACAKAMTEMMNTSSVQVLITGSSAWPALNPKTGKPYKFQEISDFGLERATNAKSVLLSMNIDGNRILTQSVVPPESDRGTTDSAKMEPHRWIKIEIKLSGR